MKLSERLNNDAGKVTAGLDDAGDTVKVSLLVKLQWLPALVVLSSMAVVGHRVNSGVRLLLSTVVLYLAFKVAAAIKQRHLWSAMSLEAWFWYWTAWPGMRLGGFTKTAEHVDHGWLRRGVVGVVVGSSILAGTVYLRPGDYVTGWLAIVGLLALVHFGYADILSWVLRRRGFQTRRLFVAPERAGTLNEFWSKRWNVAFVEMDYLLFMPPLRKISKRWAPLLMLLLSGVFHELALSYPAGGGWGLPMIYFGLHGVGMHIERTRWFEQLNDRIKPWWTRALVLGPVGLVFHQPFRDELPYQLINQLQGMI